MEGATVRVYGTREPGAQDDCVIAIAPGQPQPLDVLWAVIKGLFARAQPTEAQWREISGVADLALSRVHDAIPDEGTVKMTDLLADTAEAAAVYGYWLGYHQGRQQANARA